MGEQLLFGERRLGLFILVPSVLITITLTISCGPSLSLEDAKEAAPTLGDTNDAVQSHVKKDNLKPWIAEWDQSDKSALESQSKQELVVVRYSGRELELLNRCHLRGKYEFTATSPQVGSIEIATEDKLYAEMPLGPIDLLAEIKGGKSLTFESVIIGTRTTKVEVVAAGDLEGDCAGATHFVFSMSVGAYKISSHAKGKVGAGVDAKIVGAGASHEKEATLVSSYGDMTKCSIAPEGEPSSECNAILRLDLVKLALTPEELAVKGDSILPFKAGRYSIHVDSAKADEAVAFDAGGDNPPDIYINVSAITQTDGSDTSEYLFTTETVQDDYSPKFSTSQEVDLTGNERLHFSFVDSDAFFDDIVGGCDTIDILYKLPFQHNMLTVTNCVAGSKEVTFKLSKAE